MLRVFSTILLFAGLIVSSACSPDRSAVATISQFQSVDTTIQSRGVAVPVTFVVPVSDEPRKFPIVIMAHGHGGSREEAGGFRLVAESLAKRGVASIRIDFPGCGDSSESFTNNNLSNMLLDLQSARRFARSRTDVDNERAGLLGFSMGGRLTVLLSEIDPSYKVMALWAPAVANGAERELASLGGADIYFTLREEAQEKGLAEYTTQWGTKLQLGYRWFTDLEQTTPLEALAKFTGPLLVIYGDQDKAVPPWISEAAIEAAQSSSEVVRHVIEGAGHGLGFYSEQPAVAAEVVNSTVEFFSQRL